MKKITVLMLAVTLVMGSTMPAWASSPDSSLNQQMNAATSLDSNYDDSGIDVIQLKADIEIINNLNSDQIQDFYYENQEWLEDVNSRLEQYMEVGNSTNFRSNPVQEKRNKLNYLFGAPDINNEEFSAIERSALARNDDMLWYYFDWETYEYRGGWWTHSMDPKAATRLLRYMVDDGWSELSDKYSTIRNDNGSLYDQYICHWEALIEKEWNIEVGRPNVGLWKTILAFCNPS